MIEFRNFEISICRKFLEKSTYSGDVSSAATFEKLRAVARLNRCPLCGGEHSLSRCPRWRIADIVITMSALINGQQRAESRGTK